MQVTRRARARIAVAIGLSAAASGPACARVSGLDGLVRDDCALGCDEGGVDASRPRADAAETAAETAAAPKDTVTCGATRCRANEACCVRPGQPPACAGELDGSCATGVSVECEDDVQCAERFSGGARCCGSPADTPVSVICFAESQSCVRPRCDPSLADGGCGVGRACRPVAAGAGIGTCD